MYRFHRLAQAEWPRQPGHPDPVWWWPPPHVQNPGGGECDVVGGERSHEDRGSVRRPRGLGGGRKPGLCRSQGLRMAGVTWPGLERRRGAVLPVVALVALSGMQGALALPIADWRDVSPSAMRRLMAAPLLGADDVGADLPHGVGVPGVHAFPSPGDALLDEVMQIPVGDESGGLILFLVADTGPTQLLANRPARPATQVMPVSSWGHEAWPVRRVDPATAGPDGLEKVGREWVAPAGGALGTGGLSGPVGPTGPGNDPSTAEQAPAVPVAAADTAVFRLSERLRTFVRENLLAILGAAGVLAVLGGLGQAYSRRI